MLCNRQNESELELLGFYATELDSVFKQEELKKEQVQNLATMITSLAEQVKSLDRARIDFFGNERAAGCEAPASEESEA